LCKIDDGCRIFLWDLHTLICSLPFWLLLVRRQT